MKYVPFQSVLVSLQNIRHIFLNLYAQSDLSKGIQKKKKKKSLKRCQIEL